MSFAVYVDDVGKLFSAHIVLYADDILLLAPSVALLQRLLQACEEQLNSIDMVINITNPAVCVLARDMIQETQLSQRDRATLCVIKYFAKSLKITQGH